MRARSYLGSFAHSAIANVLLALWLLAQSQRTDGAEVANHATLAPGMYALHAGFELSLFASEPQVVDPVALTFDEHGRMYVVEMRDYPYGFGPERKPGGTIRLLEDTNGDGRADRSVVFATNLSFPTSIAPWRGGVIVTAPPEIIYLKDTNGDGRADVREVLFSGFTLGVTDSNVNGLRWGLDNRLHGLNGGNDGVIVSKRATETVKDVTSARAPVSIRGLDFSFDPATGDFTTTFHTSGGFGLVFDDWGRSFVTYNINHIQQRIIPVRYLQRFAGLPATDATTSISDHDAMSVIYPISEPETRPNHPEQSGHFSAAGGLGFAGLPGLPEDVSGSIWVCDVVGNLVHRDILREEGAIFRASRSATEQTNEFFAARDRAMRPVGCELGPDDAFYLIDMQRDVIEHPDYIPARTVAGLNLRAGDDRGRIYRLAARSSFRPPAKVQTDLSASALVKRLGDPNQWWRMTAQRILIERRDLTVVPLVRETVRGSNALGRLHALWTLNGLGALDEDLVQRALVDPHPGIRENGLLLAETFLPHSPALQRAIRDRVGDDSARVRFQAALTLGQTPSPAGRAALAALWRRDVDSYWTRLAVLSSLDNEEVELLVDILRHGIAERSTVSSNAPAVRELAVLCGARLSRTSNGLVRILEAAAKGNDRNCVVATLDGLATGRARGTEQVQFGVGASNAMAALLNHSSRPVVTGAWRLSAALGVPENETQKFALADARQRVADHTLPLPVRLENIELLALGNYQAAGETLLLLLRGPEPAEIQSAALGALGQYSETNLAQRLIEHWRSLAPRVRTQALALLLQRVAFHDALLGAIESGRLTIGELNLDLEQRRRLLRKSSPAIMARAARLISDEEYSHRKQIVDDWLRRLPSTGEPASGRLVFEKLCTACHAIDTNTPSVGPNLSTVRHRSVEDLVSNILDPNMAIHPAYIAYAAETADGEVETGVLEVESADAVVLRQAWGRRVVLPRRTLRSFQSTGTSLMPEGLEAGMTPSELRDLVAFLQQRRN